MVRTMRDPSDLELLAMHVRALYTQDSDARLLTVNQWNGGTAPRFFLGRTKGGNVWRFRNDLPAALTVALAQACRSEPPLGSSEARPAHYSEYLRLLEAHKAVEWIASGPAYLLTAFETARDPSVVAIDSTNAFLLRGGLEDWIDDVPHRRPFFTMLEEGRAVAVCASVRITALAHEAGVATLPAYRRQGHATAVVSAWAAAVEAIGAIPLYSTAWENTSSQALARRFRPRLYGADFHIG